MRAIRIHAKEDVRLEELPDPEVEPGKVDGIGEGAYTMEGGWVETVPLDDAEDAIHKLRRGQGMKILISAEPG